MLFITLETVAVDTSAISAISIIVIFLFIIFSPIFLTFTVPRLEPYPFNPLDTIPLIKYF